MIKVKSGSSEKDRAATKTSNWPDGQNSKVFVDLFVFNSLPVVEPWNSHDSSTFLSHIRVILKHKLFVQNFTNWWSWFGDSLSIFGIPWFPAFGPSKQPSTTHLVCSYSWIHNDCLAHAQIVWFFGKLWENQFLSQFMLLEIRTGGEV